GGGGRGLGRSAGRLVEARRERTDALHRFHGGLEGLAGQIELLPVVGREDEMTERRSGDVLIAQVLDGPDISDALRHLRALRQEELGVTPDARKGRTRGRLRLRDLVLVMRKHEVDPTAM